LSSFLNTTLPIGAAGDVVRVWIASRYNVPMSVSINSIVSDRILNLVSLGMLIIFMLIALMIVSGQQIFTIHINTYALTYSVLILSAFLVLLILKPMLSKLKFSQIWVIKALINLSNMNLEIFKVPSQLIRLSVVIFCGHALFIFSLILLAKGMHITPSLGQLFISMAIVVLFAAIPITPGGWGVRESAMVLTLNQFQISPEVSLSLSILFGICIIVSSIPGSIAWFIIRRMPNKSNNLSKVLPAL
jgi:uncharacterized protein (TIRG00374 family)